MNQVLFFFAIAGWLLGLTAHLFSLADINVAAYIPFIWVLHVGIFVVWLPTIFALSKNKELQAYQQSKKSGFGAFKIIFKHTPTWLMVLVIGSFIYAILNFILFASSQIGTPEMQDGQYILQNRGQFIKTITEQEYHQYKANELRGFSGHWLAFYGFAAAALFPFNKKAKEE